MTEISEDKLFDEIAKLLTDANIPFVFSIILQDQTEMTAASGTSQEINDLLESIKEYVEAVNNGGMKCPSNIPN